MEIETDLALIGGTIVAIAGDDFAVIAADTHLSQDDFILTNKQKKLFEVSPVAVMCSAGSSSDTIALIRLITKAVSDYENTHLRPISIDVMSHVLSCTLYKRRFSPLSVSTILAGIDKEGKGAVFSLDSLGNCERVNYQATGTTSATVLPLLDSRLGFKNQKVPAETIELTEAMSLVSNCMIIANEIGNNRGSCGLMKIINKDGIKVRELPLRQE